MPLNKASTIRAYKTNPSNFTTVNNEILWDPSISFDAKGLWIILQSVPKDFEFTIQNLSKKFRNQSFNKRGGGTCHIKTMVKELIEHKLLTYEVLKNEFGHYKHVYTVFADRPKTQD